MSQKIIIVEDEKPMLKALTIKLQNEGFEVANSSNAEEFFEKIKAEKFDLILLDLMLPKVSGFEIMEKMKNDTNQTPIIVTSNLSQEEDKRRSKELGAIGYVVKSDTSLNEMVEKIKSFLK